jgi:hypothetical protein
MSAERKKSFAPSAGAKVESSGAYSEALEAGEPKRGGKRTAAGSRRRLNQIDAAIPEAESRVHRAT